MANHFRMFDEWMGPILSPPQQRKRVQAQTLSTRVVVTRRAAKGHTFLFSFFSRRAGSGELRTQNMWPKSIRMIMNGVSMARHGPIFGQNEPYRLQEVFLTPPTGPRVGLKAGLIFPWSLAFYVSLSLPWKFHFFVMHSGHRLCATFDRRCAGLCAFDWLCGAFVRTCDSRRP